jgi:hypothetical protein
MSELTRNFANNNTNIINETIVVRNNGGISKKLAAFANFGIFRANKILYSCNFCG